LHHERDCFPFAAAQGFGFYAAQKLGNIGCHSERSEESRPTWDEMLRCAQHDSMSVSALRNDAAASLRASEPALRHEGASYWRLAMTGCHSAIQSTYNGRPARS
jgi:hypothetical protein